MLRLPAPLHERLRTDAANAGLSLNEFCVQRLAVSSSPLADEDEVALVQRARAMAGDASLGILLCGSWSRGEASETSDVDVLIVVGPQFAITRDLYREWDASPVRWHERSVDPHFVHPPRGHVTGDAWAEAALDGVVLLERGRQVSKALSTIRHDIADGRLVRHVVHGQPYWTSAA